MPSRPPTVQARRGAGTPSTTPVLRRGLELSVWIAVIALFVVLLGAALLVTAEVCTWATRVRVSAASTRSCDSVFPDRPAAWQPSSA